LARRSGLDWELLPQASLSAGNVLTAARLGTELRFGLNLPDDFGDATIGSGTASSTPVEGFRQAPRSRFSSFGMYAFARVDGSAVAHNIFLDGNTFANSLSVDKEPFVADVSVGFAMNFKSTKIAYALVYRTEEFKTQVEPQVFGTLSINCPF
jgi:lipid A 3-O-deacylase